jgi:hypothetical protein
MVCIADWASREDVVKHSAEVSNTRRRALACLAVGKIDLEVKALIANPPYQTSSH